MKNFLLDFFPTVALILCEAINSEQVPYKTDRIPEDSGILLLAQIVGREFRLQRQKFRYFRYCLKMNTTVFPL